MQWHQQFQISEHSVRIEHVESGSIYHSHGGVAFQVFEGVEYAFSCKKGVA